MKVNDLLSGSTISSSRALSFYSASIIAVAWTKTEPKALPGLGSLDASNLVLYFLMLVVLVFMSIAHTINWLTDEVGQKALDAIKHFEEQQEVSHKFQLKPVSQDDLVNRLEAEETKHREREDFEGQKTVAKAKLLGNLVQQHLHLSIPLGLALIAAIALLYQFVRYV